MTEPTTHAQATAAAIGSQALLMATLGLDRHALILLTRLQEVCGGDGVLDAMLLWADTYLSVVHGGPDHRPVMLTFQEQGADHETTVDEVPLPVAWAGRFLAARAARDHDTQTALIATLPTAPVAQGAHVFALLTSVACNLNARAAEIADADRVEQ